MTQKTNMPSAAYLSRGNDKLMMIISDPGDGMAQACLDIAREAAMRPEIVRIDVGSAATGWWEWRRVAGHVAGFTEDGHVLVKMGAKS